MKITIRICLCVCLITVFSFIASECKIYAQETKENNSLTLNVFQNVFDPINNLSWISVMSPDMESKIVSTSAFSKVYKTQRLNRQEEKEDKIDDINEIDETERILSLVKPSTINAKVLEQTHYYQNHGIKSLGVFSKGDIVEILYDYNRVWYKVKFGDKIGWVRRNALEIPKDPETNTQEMTKKEIEFYVNYLELESSSSYLVWVDVDRQLTHVFLGSTGKWNLIKTFKCATGKNDAPTKRGMFKIQDRGLWFYSQRLGGGAKYWVRFDGEYLFHSVAMDINQRIKDPTLGKRASSGCIRLSVEDSEWFYNYVERGTTVYIN
ncbi:UNVERIFIED_CONTAM: hypothetical protein Cloal_4331 [Acetivibrio alkalicellulosi]